jgi:NADH-quinone oxidoreductase subunit F
MNRTIKLTIKNLKKEQMRIKGEREKKADQWVIKLCAGGGCLASGEPELKKAILKALEENNVKAQIIETGCQGPCSGGPVMTIEPGRVMYEHFIPERADELVTRHLLGGDLLEDLLPQGVKPGERARMKEDAAFYAGQVRIVLGHCGEIDPLNLDDYIAADGYTALCTVLAQNNPEKVLEELKVSGLRGRGGAGFPTWRKWDFTLKADGEEKVVLCNADEGDPGAFMDRSILEGDPHQLIEGMVIAARTIGASRGYVYVRAEYPLAVARLEKAIETARDRGILGSSVMGTEWAFDMEIRMGSGAFVCGEETALIASIEGKRGEPRPRPPFPAVKGLWDKPSLLNNAETYANVAPLLRMGGKAFHDIGAGESGGTKVFALAGGIERSGLVEVPMGTSLGTLIYDIGGGIPHGREFKAAQIGGPSGGCVPSSGLNVSLDYDSLKEWGAIMGSGGLIVMDDDSCMVDVARYFLEFVQEESCGKCSSCRIGTRRMGEILTRICAGKGEEEDLDRLIELGSYIRDTALCGLGQTSPNPVLSTMKHFKEEYVRHIRDKHCDAGVCPSLVRAPCQSACPASVDIPGFVALTGEGRYAEALKLHRERNPFAAICARVCFHTCEDHCRRDSMDESVAVRGIKRFLVDQEVTIELPRIRENRDAEKTPVAIVGGGPAGLSCAYFLARLGYRPVILEAQSRPGGMLAQTIPAYRLPRETIAREIRMVESLGVDIRTDSKLGRDFTLSELQMQYKAVFLAMGAPVGTVMGIPGEDIPGVIQAIDFLKTYNLRGSVEIGKKVLIVGGGNAAIDAARTAKRLGAEEVSVIYRRDQDQMPAYSEEIEEALHEGVVLLPLTQPIEICADQSGRVGSVRCMKMTLGEFDRSGRRHPEEMGDKAYNIEADQVILAIGQRMDEGALAGKDSVDRNAWKFIASDPVTAMTNLPGVFAGGDVSDGPSSVVSAIACGEKAAVGINQYLTGEEGAFWREDQVIETEYDPAADPLPYPREKLSVIPPERRSHNFDEVEKSWPVTVACRQAKRCLRCDYGKNGLDTAENRSNKELNHV